MTAIDDKLDALNKRLKHLESDDDESDPESESLYWLNGHFGNKAYHFEIILHEILLLTDDLYVADGYKIEEGFSKDGTEDED